MHYPEGMRPELEHMSAWQSLNKFCVLGSGLVGLLNTMGPQWLLLPAASLPRGSVLFLWKLPIARPGLGVPSFKGTMPRSLPFSFLGPDNKLAILSQFQRLTVGLYGYSIYYGSFCGATEGSIKKISMWWLKKSKKSDNMFAVMVPICSSWFLTERYAGIVGCLHPRVLPMLHHTLCFLFWICTF